MDSPNRLAQRSFGEAPSGDARVGAETVFGEIGYDRPVVVIDPRCGTGSGIATEAGRAKL